jgi:hypothetical protein
MAATSAGAAEGVGPPRYISRAQAPPAVEAELATRDVVCRMSEEGGLTIPERSLGEADLNGDGRPDYVITLCRIGCAQNMPPPGIYCDQSLVIVSSGGTGYQPIKMPGELLDVRVRPGEPTAFLSSSISDHAVCPVADRVCNPLYVIRGGQIVQVGME